MSRVDGEKIKQGLRERQLSVAAWARLHGFKPDTVRRLLAGRYGERQREVARAIIRALREDGLL